jgi:hypothetical protein
VWTRVGVKFVLGPTFARVGADEYGVRGEGVEVGALVEAAAAACQSSRSWSIARWSVLAWSVG